MRNRIGQWAALAWIAAGLVAGLLTSGAQEPSRIAAGALERGFRNPPDEARPSAYYLMLNGYLNRYHVGRELEELAAKGVRGLCIFDMGGRGLESALPPAGPAFLSDVWFGQLAVILEKAEELGMSAQLAVSSSWDMGASWVEPEDASMALYHSSIEIDGPAEIDALLPLPEIPAKAPRDAGERPLVLHEIAVLAFPRTGSIEGSEPVIPQRTEIADISASVDAEGRLAWNAPPGRWTVLRFVCANTGERLKVPSPNSDGLATDHFNAEVTRRYLEHLIERLEARFGDLRRTALKHLYLPSYEVVGRVWTPDLLEQFRKYRGYDMTLFLPALVGYVIEGRQTTEDFLYDFRKTMGDLLVDAYYRTASETARQAGLGVEAEAGGPGPPVHQVPVDALKALAAIDEMRGEFWPWRLTNSPLWVVKETASAAHVYGRRFVHMEAFTGFHHWTAGPYDLKFSADRAFGEGMNHVVWHTSSHQPPEAGVPGWVYGAGTHLTPNLVWWPMAGAFLDYLARCSHLLQQGLFVADVCYYSGDQGYNFVPPKHVDPSLGFGHDYDVINAEALLTRMSVKDGQFVLPDGMRYEVLVLPDREDMDPDVLEKLAELVEAGATVVGPRPVRANGLADREARDRKVRRIADAVWGVCDGVTVFENRYGEGTVVWGRSLRAVLDARGVGPDFQFSAEAEDAELDFIHRRTSDADIYFVRNARERWETVEAVFRVGNKLPELWRPESGEIRACAVFERTGDGIRVPLKLAPRDSVFVVFRAEAPPVHLTKADPELTIVSSTEGGLEALASRDGSYEIETSDGEAITLEFQAIPRGTMLEGPWTIHFSSGWGAPESVMFDTLSFWTEHEMEAIRHYSGIARYEISFEVPPRWGDEDVRVDLDLGNLWSVGKVSLNGRDLGIVWKPPFRLDVTGMLEPGTNRLEVEVANTWANRLIGDAGLPAGERRTRTNITRSGGKSWGEVAPRESGLLGPVRLIPVMTRGLRLSE